MRKAFDKLLEKAWVHDAGDTAAQAGIGAVIMAANGMEAEDIAAATGIGAATAMIARPSLRAGGAFIGKQFDGLNKQAPDFYTRGMMFVPGTRHNKASIDYLAQDEKANPALRAMMQGIKPINDKRVDAYYRDRNGKPMGMIEGDAAVLARMFGDNVLQAGIQLAIPSMMGQSAPVNTI